ncbi:pentapeptide repeat-containing protein [Coleofasciculus sp. F4-SAH-05]|uniref:pentapeptide repeat-containing protein n=1 Tax=Coleofasciculus sp. F4-SAH-05 TaxID=3069525 RepID=UPI0032F9AD2C
MQVQNFLTRYRQGDRDFAQVDLSGVNLKGADLRTINLSGANLTNANLSWTSLDYANLNGACLHQADLHNAILKHSNLNQAILTRVNLSKVDGQSASLCQANLSWVEAPYCNLSGANLQAAQLNHSNLTGAILDKTQLISTQLMAANLYQASLIAANLTTANLREVLLEKANLQDAILVGATLTEANLRQACLRCANLTQAELYRAILTDADLSEVTGDRVNLSRANLMGAYLLRASFVGANLRRTVLQNVYCLQTNLTGANLQGADLRQADLSGAYLNETILTEANLTDAYLIGSYLIRPKLEQAQLTGCCIHNWHLEEVDLTNVNCRYLFTQFNWETKTPNKRYPPTGDLIPGQLSQEKMTDWLLIEVTFSEMPNREVLVFTLAQVEQEYPDLKLSLKALSKQFDHYILHLSAKTGVNPQAVNQRILELYPQMYQRFAHYRHRIWQLLEIDKSGASQLNSSLNSANSPNPTQVLANNRRRIYQEVIHQIQQIILFQPPDKCAEGIQRLLDFLRQQNIPTQDIVPKIIRQAMLRRAKRDPLFQTQLLAWKKTADQATRMSLTGQAMHGAIALILSQVQPP